MQRSGLGEVYACRDLAPTDTCEIWGLEWAWWGVLGKSATRPQFLLVIMKARARVGQTRQNPLVGMHGGWVWS